MLFLVLAVLLLLRHSSLDLVQRGFAKPSDFYHCLLLITVKIRLTYSAVHLSCPILL